MIRRVLRKIQKVVLPPPPPEPFFTAKKAAYAQYQIGEGTYGSPRILSWDQNTTLLIGRYCSIAEDVTIFLGGEHRTDWVTTYPFSVLYNHDCKIEGHPTSRGNVVIGNDVWIGWGATILSGVTIGDGAVIGAHSLVTKDVPPYTIVGGNPAQFIRERFPEAVRQSLVEIAWWNWSDDKIRAAWPLLLSSEVQEFIACYKGEATHTLSERGI